MSLSLDKLWMVYIVMDFIMLVCMDEPINFNVLDPINEFRSSGYLIHFDHSRFGSNCLFADVFKFVCNGARYMFMQSGGVLKAR
jgi:hypothetical protein